MIGLGVEEPGALLLRCRLRRLHGLLTGTPQAPDQRPARLARTARGRHVAVGGLADPALVIGPRRAQLADQLPLAARREVRLGALPFEDGPAAHGAAHRIVRGPQLFTHDQAMLAGAASYDEG